MGYARWFIFTFLYMTVINLISRDIGLVSVEYSFKKLRTAYDGSLLDKILYPFYIFVDNIASMTQFLTLSADVPTVLNLVMIGPVYIGTVIAVITLIRGK